MKTLIVIVCALFVNVTVAETYVQINGASVHDRSGFNSFNYGAGIEHTVADRWSVAGGWYRNSEYRGSTYGYARYAVYKSGPWNIGVGAGVVSGYNSYKVMPMAFPEVCYSYVCAITIPKVNANGANALAFHLRVPI
jgi:uncharacterized membrane protein